MVDSLIGVGKRAREASLILPPTPLTAIPLYPIPYPLPFNTLPAHPFRSLTKAMPEQTKVMGKDWADARREGSVDRLRLTLQTALADQTMITFELGCGHGHWLAAYGAAHPAEYCVGIDLVTHRVERSQRKQALGKLTNVVFLKAEATEFLDALLPTQQLAKIFILYPDPWPKKRHQKNRFINAANLDRLADHAIAGATLHFRTDSEAYHAWTREHLAAHPRWQLVEGTPWPFERTTFFEDMMKAKRDLLAVRLP